MKLMSPTIWNSGVLIEGICKYNLFNWLLKALTLEEIHSEFTNRNKTKFVENIAFIAVNFYNRILYRGLIISQLLLLNFAHAIHRAYKRAYKYNKLWQAGCVKICMF